MMFWLGAEGEKQDDLETAVAGPTRLWRVTAPDRSYFFVDADWMDSRPDGTLLFWCDEKRTGWRDLVASIPASCIVREVC